MKSNNQIRTRHVEVGHNIDESGNTKMVFEEKLVVVNADGSERYESFDGTLEDAERILSM